MLNTGAAIKPNDGRQSDAEVIGMNEQQHNSPASESFEERVLAELGAIRDGVGEIRDEVADFRSEIAEVDDEPSLGAAAISELTPRQVQVLKLIADGRTTKQIALDLNISVKTAESHRAQLMERLGIYDVAGLVRFAIRMRLVSADAA